MFLFIIGLYKLEYNFMFTFIMCLCKFMDHRWNYKFKLYKLPNRDNITHSRTTWKVTYNTNAISIHLYNTNPSNTYKTIHWKKHQTNTNNHNTSYKSISLIADTYLGRLEASNKAAPTTWWSPMKQEASIRAIFGLLCAS